MGRDGMKKLSCLWRRIESQESVVSASTPLQPLVCTLLRAPRNKAVTAFVIPPDGVPAAAVRCMET